MLRRALAASHPPIAASRFQFLADWQPYCLNPIADLELGLDILYNHINSAFEGPVTASANGTIPPGLFTARDQNVLSGALRIQRNFVP